MCRWRASCARSARWGFHGTKARRAHTSGAAFRLVTASQSGPLHPDGWHSSEHDGDWAKLARLWTSVCAAYPLTTDRNAEYLEWRYGPRAPACKIVQIRCPNRVLRAWYAYLLARRGGRLTAWISNLLDLMVDPLDSVAIRVSAEDFIRRSRQEGAAIAQVKGLRKTLRASFSSAGFRPRRLPQNPFLCTLPSTLSAEEASELRNVRDQWHFVSGDGDAGFADVSATERRADARWRRFARGRSRLIRVFRSLGSHDWILL